MGVESCLPDVFSGNRRTQAAADRKWDREVRKLDRQEQAWIIGGGVANGEDDGSVSERQKVVQQACRQGTTFENRSTS